jgi:lysine 2,3-aminomutase
LSRRAEGRPSTLPFVSSEEKLSELVPLTEKLKQEILRVSRVFPMRIPEFYLSLFEKNNVACPLRRQSVPSEEELATTGQDDPLDEENYFVTPSFIKKYPGRGVFLATAQCAMYCRFCNRRRLVGRGWDPRISWEESFRYMELDEGLREVIVSGGDPFTLSVKDFSYMMKRLKNIKRIQVIRISTRLPVVFPEGIKNEHFMTLKNASPVWVVIHINHPREISPAFMGTIRTLRKAGINMVSQSVLLRGVNDCPHILLKLFETLVSIGVKPYYLFQLDEVRGVMHFKVSVKEGVRIMHFLRRHGSGLAIPHYALDITGGIGKVPLDHQYLIKRDKTMLHLESLSGERGTYTDDGKNGQCQGCGICGQREAAAKKVRS